MQTPVSPSQALAPISRVPPTTTHPVEFEEDGTPDLSTVKPLIDGGTEGFKGHVRVLLPGLTPCFECTLWLFPPQTKFPLCTLAETPR
jgi:ubiquitin-activating enzyme E1 C